jgi:hypothetical protein
MSFTADRVTRQALTGRSLLVPSNLDSWKFSGTRAANVLLAMIAM